MGTASPGEPLKSERRLQVEARVDFILTIVLDGAVILSAIVVRAGLLWVLGRLAPPETRNWAIAGLEWIADIGMVAVSATFTVFDLLKRVREAYASVFGRSHA